MGSRLLACLHVCWCGWHPCVSEEACFCSIPQAQLEAQRATQDFQRATEVLRAAKETIALAEQRLLEDDKRQFDSAWQEMLNHATQRVSEAPHTQYYTDIYNHPQCFKMIKKSLLSLLQWK